MLLAVALMFSSGVMLAQTVHPDFIDGRVYMKLKNSYSLPYSQENGAINMKNLAFMQDLISKYNVSSVRNTFHTANDINLERTFLVKFANKSQVDEFIKELERKECIERVEKAPLFKLHYTPSDYGTTAANNWHLTKINAQGAWDVSHGDANIKVAVLDIACYANHPDLINKIAAKIDLADGDGDPTPPAFSSTLDPTWSHGTHTAGLVGAHTDNGVGISSIGFNVSLIPVKVAEDSSMAMSAGLEGIVWAADTGAHVINMSWGSPQFVQVMQDVVSYAYNKGCVMLASAGNNGDGASDPNTENAIMYPANCDHVIAVGSTNGNDKASSFSQFGTWIDVMAPGGYQNDGGILDQIMGYSVYSSVYTSAAGGYGKMQGTSMSAPIAAGLCALILSINPYLTPDEVTNILKTTCTNIESLQDATHQGMVGAGRINAQAAAVAAQNSVSAINANFFANSVIIAQGGSITFTDNSNGTGINSWEWSFTGGTPSSFTGQTPPAIMYDIPGIYDVSLTISDGANTDTETKVGLIVVNAPPPPSAWIEQAAGYTALYRGAYMLSIVDENIAWSTAVDGTNGNPVNEYTKTTNGGFTWQPGTMTGVPATTRVSNISAVSGTTAFIAVYNTSVAGGAIWKTTDGGVSWTKITNTEFTNSTSFPNVVHFWDDNTGWAMGDPVSSEFELYTTSDGGATWTVVPVANIPNAVSGEMGWTDVYSVYGDYIWFATNKGRILKSTNKGLNWEIFDTGMGDCQKVSFSDADNGIVQRIVYSTTDGSITTFTMKVTHDGGATWTAVTPTEPIYKSDISAVPGLNGRLISVGSDGGSQTNRTYGSSFSLDYGATWTLIDTGLQYINTKFYDEFTGYATGFCTSASQGGMYKWSPAIVSTPSIVHAENAFSLFPNPASSYVVVENSFSDFDLHIYNVLGQEVMRTNVQQNSVSIDLNGFEKGVYFAVVKSENKVSTSKFIVK
ncbi:MAG: hypothetical protein A2275_01635 [Bacteroidetes bacterium RIFOXYA12_FULL_35_11]|nr:MAG: hypothetical protein A2X01_04875 [Bacteroidetes bacterium GWF2_35_48]OFY72917.1 MAG: hypothetical protein A2275_01635 [Bacteroidetes bacterium RIFOXYA12_FULL_35_11]